MMKIILGEDYDRILRWAIGDDYRYLVWSLWPERIRERTGLEVYAYDDVEDSLREMKAAWDERKSGE